MHHFPLVNRTLFIVRFFLYLLLNRSFQIQAQLRKRIRIHIEKSVYDIHNNMIRSGHNLEKHGGQTD